MRIWTRVRVRDARCQGCGALMYRGDPVQEIRLPDVTRPLTRCVQCAEGQPPADLPEAGPDAPIIAPMPRAKAGSHGMRAIGSMELPADFKRKQSGDDAA